jgi:hypothetical protein
VSFVEAAANGIHQEAKSVSAKRGSAKASRLDVRVKCSRLNAPTSLDLNEIPIITGTRESKPGGQGYRRFT